MAISDLANIVDGNKVILTKIYPSNNIAGSGWTQHGVYTNTWYTSFTAGIPDRIKQQVVDDTIITNTERFSIAECDGTASSWYYDFTNKVLYVHTAGSDDPGVDLPDPLGGERYIYAIIVNYWYYFTNKQFTDFPVIYPRTTEAFLNPDFENWTSSTALVNWSLSAGGSSTVSRVYVSDRAKGAYVIGMVIDAGNTQGNAYQDITLPSGAKCKLSIDYKHADPAKTSKIIIRDSGSNKYLNSSGNWQTASTTIFLANSTDWLTYEITFNAHESYTNYRIQFASLSAASTTCWFDNSSVKVYREDNYYLPFLSNFDLPAIEQSIDFFFSGAFKQNYGKLSMVNAGFWYEELVSRNFESHTVESYLGQKEDDIEDFELIYSGRIKNPTTTNSRATFTIIDDRVLTSKTIPTEKFWVADYANLEEGASGFVIPVIYGQIANIAPISIDTTTFTYKLAGHELEDITDVYKDGDQLTITTDYTLDLANGEFTLVADPEDGFITCDVKGKKCDFEDGTYSENVADILYDILVNLVGIEVALIDLKSLVSLKISNTENCMLYLDTPHSSTEKLRTLMGSSMFVIIETIDRKIKFVPEAIGSGLPVVYDWQISNYREYYNSSTIYSDIIIRYNRNPADNKWDRKTSDSLTNSRVNVTYNKEKTFTFSSAFRNAGAATNLTQWYYNQLSSPVRTVEMDLPMEFFDLNASDKIYINKTEKDRDGNDYAVLTNELFKILSIKKNFRTGLVRIKAVVYTSFSADRP